MSSGFNKLSDNNFINILKRMDLFCLSETHVGPDFDVFLENFHTYKSCRKLSANNRFLEAFVFSHQFILRMVSKLSKMTIKISYG